MSKNNTVLTRVDKKFINTLRVKYPNPNLTNSTRINLFSEEKKRADEFKVRFEKFLKRMEEKIR